MGRGYKKAVFGQKPLISVESTFIMKVKTDNSGTSTSTQFTLPISGDNFTVRTSDGQEHTGLTGSITIEFGVAGEYDIEVSGDWYNIAFNDGGDKLKALDIKQWGSNQWSTNYQSFHGCANLVCTAADAPKLSSYLRRMFRGCTNIVIDNIQNWGVSHVTSLDEMFMQTNFNGDISGWDVSNVDDMTSCLRGCSNFSYDISNWNVSKVLDMYYFCPTLSSAYPYLDDIYNKWSQLPLQSGVPLHFGNAKYSSAGQAGRDILTGTFGWGLVDGGLI